MNHYETIINNTVDQAIKFREMVGEPNLMIHLDTFHMNLEEKACTRRQKRHFRTAATTISRKETVGK